MTVRFAAAPLIVYPRQKSLEIMIGFRAFDFFGVSRLPHIVGSG